MSSKTITSVLVAPHQVIKGEAILAQGLETIASLGKSPLVIHGSQTHSLVTREITPTLEKQKLTASTIEYSPDCCESSVETIKNTIVAAEKDIVIGVGGGKALDTAKLVAYQCRLPVVTIPTSAATCAAWTPLSNIYSAAGAFEYDISLDRSPDLLILDYNLVQTAPSRTLVAGIGDAIAKWYEASVSSGDSTATLTIAAVQQARILRDILFQKAATALQNPGSEDWREVVDANVLLAGVIGGLGGANCRTVAAHAVHNGLTALPQAHHALHGEKVAYGILVQLRLEEMLQGNQLATSAREQLIGFYTSIGLPQSLEDLGLTEITLKQLRQVANVTCQPQSDIHRLPFAVTPEQLIAAMVSTKVKVTM